MLTHEYIKQEFEQVQSLGCNPERELYLDFFKAVSTKQDDLANTLGALLKVQQLLCLDEYVIRS